MEQDLSDRGRVSMEASLERAGYTDVSRLGAGSFGSVFLGRKQSNNSKNSRSKGANSTSGSVNFSKEEAEGAVALKRLTATTAPHRVVLEMQLLRQAAHGSEFIPALMDGFHDSVSKYCRSYLSPLSVAIITSVTLLSQLSFLILH